MERNKEKTDENIDIPHSDIRFKIMTINASCPRKMESFKMISYRKILRPILKFFGHIIRRYGLKKKSFKEKCKAKGTEDVFLLDLLIKSMMK